MSNVRVCKCGRPTDSVGACPTCGQFPAFCRCEHVRFPGCLTHSAGVVPYAQGALRLKEYDQLPPHITREQYLNMLNAVKRKYSSAGQ